MTPQQKAFWDQLHGQTGTTFTYQGHNYFKNQNGAWVDITDPRNRTRVTDIYGNPIQAQFPTAWPAPPQQQSTSMSLSTQTPGAPTQQPPPQQPAPQPINAAAAATQNQNGLSNVQALQPQPRSAYVFPGQVPGTTPTRFIPRVMGQ